VNNCSYEREFCNKGITNPHGVFSGIARHSIFMLLLLNVTLKVETG
jgi:hypothetical protein